MVIKLFYLLLSMIAFHADAQKVLKGKISAPFNKSLPLDCIEIRNNAGDRFFSELSGKYQIPIKGKDTIKYFYKGKLIDAFIYNGDGQTPTYNVTLGLNESGVKGHELEAVKVYGRNFKSDSVLRRDYYKELYNYEDPTLAMGDNQWAEYVYVMGEKMQLNSMDKKFSLLDIQSLIHVFSFKKRNRRKRDQRFALQAEQDDYIRHRLKKDLIEKYGHIHNDDSLNVFIKRYSPSYVDLKKMSDFEMCQYIAVKAKLYVRGKLD